MTASDIDLGALRRSLEKALRGEVRFDGATRAIYATDSSNYRHVPLGVVYPADADDLAAAVATCRDLGAPVLARGAGTSLAGQGCNEALVIDTSRHLDAIVALDADARTARVQPGVVLDSLRDAAARHGLTFGPDPATHAWCTLGGMVGNNSCGTHGLTAGRTSDNVERLEVVTYRGARLSLGAMSPAERAAARAGGGELGRIVAALEDLARTYGEEVRSGFPRLLRRVSGYNLDELLEEKGFNLARALVGSESTCVLVSEITVALVDRPTHRRLVVLGYPDVFSAADHVPELLEHGLAALEGFDEVLIEHMRAAKLNLEQLSLLPEGRGFLLAEVADDSEDEAMRKALALADAATGASGAKVLSSPAEQAGVWKVRESGLGATARPPGEPPNLEGWEDAAVPPERLGEYLRGIAELWERHGYRGAWYGHFGQGCVHTRNNFDLQSREGLASYRSYVEQAAELCVGLGGSLSGEHGDGQARGELLEKMFGPRLLQAFEAFKAIWDPDAKCNPGRVVHARPLDEDLHHGPDYRTVNLAKSHFALSEDGGSLQHAAERCVGVGRCRSQSGGVMCPSFRATGDEKHSTRGRAKLLVEMFQGEVTPATYRNDEVFDALSLCLSCKGCAIDCPTHVDMATYKAEFLSHYYRRRLRPIADYVLGLLPWLLRPAKAAPRLANALLGEHPPSRLARRLAGITTRRPAPRLARTAFRKSAAARSRVKAPGATVALFPDTFSDAYVPERLEATIALLEAAGETVTVITDWACCGRPLYDAGMLDLARRTLGRLVGLLEPYARQSLPIIVAEPSCLAAIRDELPQLLNSDARAAAVTAAARSLAEHLVAIGYVPARRVHGRSVALHPHCHQRATGGTNADRAVLESAGFDVTILDAGCCGLAGSFGFHAEHDELSRRIAATGFARVLADLPRDSALVVDGFSCATQATQLELGSSTSLAELLASVVLDARADQEERRSSSASS